MPRTQNRASLLHFEGQRCKAGYRWLVEDGPERDFGLVPVSDQTMSFEPASTLFLEFSRVAPQKTAIQEFANANGLLGLPAPGLFEGGRRFDGERLSAWLMQINRMHLAVELWRHVQKGDRRGLEHHIEWKSDRIVYRGDACLGEEAADREISAAREPREYHRLRDGKDSLAAARAFLEKAINAQLRGRDYLLDPARPANIAVRLTTIGDQCGLAIAPTTLLGFLWLQLAEAVSEGVAFRECEACGRAIGSRQLTCSGTCRMKVYLARIDKAVALHNRGKTLPEIARELDVRATKGRSPVQIVKAWIHGAADRTTRRGGRKGK